VASPPRTAALLLDRIEESVLEFIGGAERSDDIALLAVRRDGGGAP
jgi:serine phosphatase RsbU (regulator of sigma subunit)